jgi:hypothetical protein
MDTKEPETLSPKAKLIRAMMAMTMNLDLHELIEAQVIDERSDGGINQWEKWNADAPKFIMKLDDRRMNSLAFLVSHRFKSAFEGWTQPNS